MAQVYDSHVKSAAFYGRIVQVATVAVLASVLAAQGAAAAAWTAPAPLNSNAHADSGVDSSPQVTTDGTGTWLAVWSSDATLGGTIAADLDILVARSTDKGATWTVAAALNSNAETDAGDDTLPQAATDGKGTWLAVWSSTDTLGDTIDTDEDVLVARSTDSGMTWTTPVPLNANAGTDSGGDDAPQVATDGSGNWVAVWTSRDSLDGTIGTDVDVLVSRSSDNGATWTPPTPLNTNAATDRDDDNCPQVATDGNGNWVTVWESWNDVRGGRSADTDILVARSTDDGATWTAVAALNANAQTDVGSDAFPQLATDAKGTWVAVWSSTDTLVDTSPTKDAPRNPNLEEDLETAIGEDRDILVARSTDSGMTWTPPAPLNTNAATDSDEDDRPELATDGSGNWVCLWSARSAGVVAARSTDNGASWTDAAPVVGSGRYHQVATDGAGNWVCVWVSWDDLGRTIGTDEDILVARSTDNGATWTARAPLNSYAETDASDDRWPRVATDGSGTWVAVWSSTDTLGGTIGTDWDVLVARSTDNGAKWSAGAPLSADAESDSDNEGAAELATDGRGTWVAAWSATDTTAGTMGTDADILVARSTDNGATWSPPAPLNTNAQTDSIEDGAVELATDGKGNWVAVWWSHTSFAAPPPGSARRRAAPPPRILRVLASRSTDNGATWSPPAPLNTNANADSGSDSFPHVATDRVGNWVAVWGSGNDLGGTIGNDEDILVARSTDNGATWSPPIALSTNAGADSGVDGQPRVATDGAGTWVAVWRQLNTLPMSPVVRPDHVLLSRSTDNGATWTPPVALDTIGKTDSEEQFSPEATTSVHSPEVATDGRGTWVAAWRCTGSVNVGMLVAHSTDNGVTWTPPAVLDSPAANREGLDVPGMATDGKGIWVAVWGSNNTLGNTIGRDRDVLVSRFADEGQPAAPPR
jgi:hypothetical protein